jgi:putative transposase
VIPSAVQLNEHVSVFGVVTHALDETASGNALAGEWGEVDHTAIFDIHCFGSSGFSAYKGNEDANQTDKAAQFAALLRDESAHVIGTPNSASMEKRGVYLRVERRARDMSIHTNPGSRTREVAPTPATVQFSRIEEWVQVLKDAGVAISMDGKGRWMDNVFIERLWRSVKYEEVYLRAYTNGTDARTSLARYFRPYNAVRSHQSLDYRTPDEVYFGELAVVTPMAA